MIIKNSQLVDRFKKEMVYDPMWYITRNRLDKTDENLLRNSVQRPVWEHIRNVWRQIDYFKTI